MEKDKKKKPSTSTQLRRTMPGQLGKDLVESVTKKIKGASKAKKKK